MSWHAKFSDKTWDWNLNIDLGYRNSNFELRKHIYVIAAMRGADLYGKDGSKEFWISG